MEIKNVVWKEENVEFVNLTPHRIVVFDEQGKNVIAEIEPSGTVARVKTEQVVIGVVNGIPVVKTRFMKVEGMPEPEEGKCYIVSSIVAQAVARDYPYVVAPDTSLESVVEDEQGRIIGVRRFQIF